MDKKIAAAVFLALSLFTQVPAASALQLGAKIGYHFYPPSKYADFLEDEPVDADAQELDGPVVEAFMDFSILPFITLEAGLGGHSSKTDLPSPAGDLKLNATYLVLTPKVHLTPLASKMDLYAGLGVGLYFLKQSIGAGDVISPADNKGAGGIHATVGMGWYLTRNFLILVEGRYARVVIKDADEAGHDFNMGGLYLQTGAAIAW